MCHIKVDSVTQGYGIVLILTLLEFVLLKKGAARPSSVTLSV